MRRPIFSATTRIFAASSGGMTRPSTPSKPAALICVSSSSVGRAMSAFRCLVLNVSGAAGAAGLACAPPPRPGSCAPAAPAPTLRPAASAVEAVMNSRRLIGPVISSSRTAHAPPNDADYAARRASRASIGLIRSSRPPAVERMVRVRGLLTGARRSSSTVSAVASFQPRTRACDARRRFQRIARPAQLGGRGEPLRRRGARRAATDRLRPAPPPTGLG